MHVYCIPLLSAIFILHAFYLSALRSFIDHHFVYTSKFNKLNALRPTNVCHGAEPNYSCSFIQLFKESLIVITPADLHVYKGITTLTFDLS